MVKYKILVIGDSPTIPTGFGNVIKQLSLGFYNAGYEIKVLGWGHSGKAHDFPFQIISPIDRRDYFGEKQAETIIELWKPDIVFTLGDPYMNSWIKNTPKRKTFIHIGYFPIDGTPLPDSWIPIIEDMDYPIVFSNFALGIVEKAISNKNINLILHGVDANVFRPLNKSIINDIREINNLNGKFIIGNVARNQWRKNLPALFKAFAEFSEDKDDAILYYHGAIQDVGWNVIDLIKRFNLSEKVLYPDLKSNEGVGEEDLNKLYNLMDLFVLPTLGEGFGLPLIESQSAGTPILVTDFSACTELAQGNDELIKVKTLYTPIVKEKSAIIDYALVDHEDMIEKMNNFYYNRELIDKYSKLGREFALKHQWESKINEFLGLISNI